MDLGLQGKRALVTAASRGLGRAAARALAQEGAHVAINGRSTDTEDAAEAIEAETGQAVIPIRADLTDAGEIQRLVQEALEKLGGIDILIINAGGPPPGAFLDLEPADWESAIELTLMSAVRLSYAVVPGMIERAEGSIVTNQSYSVKQPIDNLVLSNSLRMAVIGMMKTMANELGPRGIRVNSINPAWTWTERVEQLMQDRAQRAGTSVDEEASRVSEAVPLGRMGTVEEYGRALAWLASPAASFIHGHALMFDGGAVKAAL